MDWILPFGAFLAAHLLISAAIENHPLVGAFYRTHRMQSNAKVTFSSLESRTSSNLILRSFGRRENRPLSNEPFSSKNPCLLQHTSFVFLAAFSWGLSNSTIFTAIHGLLNQLAMASKVGFSLSSSFLYSSSSSVAPCAPPSLGGKRRGRQRLFGVSPLRLCHLSRRLFLPSAVPGIWDALTGGNSASIAVRRGMQLFRQVYIPISIWFFQFHVFWDPWFGHPVWSDESHHGWWIPHLPQLQFYFILFIYWKKMWLCI